MCHGWNRRKEETDSRAKKETVEERLQREPDRDKQKERQPITPVSEPTPAEEILV
jgi:hypothetical protein